MNLIGLLVAGFLLGVRHALDPDHLAAVASISTEAKSIRDRVTQGAVWGIGHTLTLLVFGGVAILLGNLIPETLSAWLEAAVGLMLVLLGLDVLRRVRAERVHIHVHAHDLQEQHLHFHYHREDVSHDHSHPKTFPFRALFVGLMHGMAGSAALVLLAVSATTQPSHGMAYVIVFGIGSILGMAALSAVLSLPLRSLPIRYHRQLRTGLGLATMGADTSLTRRGGPVACFMRRIRARVPLPPLSDR